MSARVGSRIEFEDVHPDDIALSGPVRVVLRTGVIWSLANGAGCVWVIPDGGGQTVKVRTSTRPKPRRVEGPRPVPNLLERAK